MTFPLSTKRFYTQREVREILGLKHSTYYRLLKTEPLLRPTHAFGPRGKRIEDTQLEEFIRQRTTAMPAGLRK
jgi:predicted DNA-binding transcriptional regulator AlpA